ncbi:ESX secretion-associated protein EspG [Nocardia sp. NPDC127579]|uniref:ESX secretion-associated protein EspG n=1 Tax=Nocardia sp. NPDC127579 TaxID=3345402 RepID=UPI003638B2BB
MTGSWTFTDLEFAMLWEMVSSDFLPAPLVFARRSPLGDGHRREKREIAAHSNTSSDQALRHLFETIARPDIRITVSGWHGESAEDLDGRIRILAARRSSRGYRVGQAPDGGITVDECDALALGRMVAEALPDCVAGSVPRLVLEPPASLRAGLDLGFRQPLSHEWTEDPDRDKLQFFLASAKVGAGTIEIIQGTSRFGSRGITRRELAWRDLANDGRYALTGSRPPIAIAIDSHRLTGLINTEIAEVVRAIKDERS